MARKRSSKITPLPVAIKEAEAYIAKKELPTHKALAEQWNCSTQRVQYVLRKIKAGNQPAKRRGRPPLGSSVKNSHSGAVQLPIFKSIVETLVKFEQELVDVVKHVLSIRGLKPAEQKNIVKKGQAEIWGEVHGSLSHHLEKVASPHYS